MDKLPFIVLLGDMAAEAYFLLDGIVAEVSFLPWLFTAQSVLYMLYLAAKY